VDYEWIGVLKRSSKVDYERITVLKRLISVN